MEKKEYCLSFIDVIKNQDKGGLYKFFTRKTIIIFLEGYKEVSVLDFIDYIEEHFFNKEIKVLRTLESKVCTKIELEVDDEPISFIIELKERRIRRLEVFKIELN